jgi:radical SAM protein with 4Fe4S-binding SPASM domain
MISKKRDTVPWSTAYSMNRVSLRDSIPLEIPLCICIEPTNICNFKCLMCWQSTEEYKYEGGPFFNMDMDLFHKILVDIQAFCKKTKKKIKLVKLYSTGEPLLHPEIATMLREIKEADICNQVEITTNGALLTKVMAESFVQSGLDYLRVSIYSVLSERQAKITQSNVTPEQILENIKYLKNYRDGQCKNRPFIAAKIMDTHTDENDRFREMYRNISDEQVIDVPWDLPGLEEKPLDRLYGSEKSGEDAEKAYLEKVGISTRQVCRYPFTHLTIRNNGDAVVCCTDWARSTKLGNVCQQSIEEIWTSRALFDFRVMQLKTKGKHHPLCKDCPIPLQNKPEDDLSGVPVEVLNYKDW